MIIVDGQLRSREGLSADSHPRKDFGEQTGTSLTWTVDIAAGTRVSLRITDSTGAVNYAEAVEIRAGSNTNCLNR